MLILNYKTNEYRQKMYTKIMIKVHATAQFCWGLRNIDDHLGEILNARSNHLYRTQTKPNQLDPLPICEARAKDLIKACSLAPFGQKEKTVYDTSVRNTWQLDPYVWMGKIQGGIVAAVKYCTITTPHWK